MIQFPISGVETWWWLPPAVAFVISLLTSMGGVSGAFLILPFQMSVLGFVSPAVSPTNLIFNIVAIPSGVYRYIREGRMVWPLALLVIAGTLPGVFLGMLIRLQYLPDPKPFKAFVGLVLLYIGVRLLLDLLRSQPRAAPTDAWRVETRSFDWRRLVYRFQGTDHRCPTAGVMLMSLVVGTVGGIYGIGGGAIVAPFFVAIFRLPVHTVAGATLMGTLVTSVAGVLFYHAAAAKYADRGLEVAPDWLLGALFGLGGMAGMYLGARLQRRMPARAIKLLLMVVLLAVAIRYLAGYLGSS